MKKYFLPIILMSALVFISTFAFAWSDNSTHPKITEIAGRVGGTHQ